MKNKNLGQSLKNAFCGIVFSIDGERNMKVHTIAAAIAVAMSIALRVSLMELLFIILSIAMVLITELLNTAIEYLINVFYANEFNVNIKKVKDISAAAVLIAALFSLSAGYTVFVPKLLNLIGIHPDDGLYFIIMASTAAAAALTFLLLSATKRRRV